MTIAVDGWPEAQGPAGIPNFAWVEEGRVARGRQPTLTLSAYRELQDYGFATVLSLRPPREYPDDEWRRYDAEEERALCQALGLTFRHVPCTDFQAPRPHEVVQALAILRDEVVQGHAVYVHCFAGVGRTGVICGAWQMVRGASGTEALRQFTAFCQESWQRRAALRRPELSMEQYLDNIGAHQQVWVLVRIAKALGRPVQIRSGMVRPQRPARAATWRRQFQLELQRRLGDLDGLALTRADAIDTGGAARVCGGSPAGV